MQFIDLKTQYTNNKAAIDQRIQAVLDHGQYIMGPEVFELEEQLAKYVGVKHCISISSGTDALLVALMALNIKPGDEVITVPFTFVATVEVVALLGLKPVFVDVDPDTMMMDMDQVEAKISSRTKAVIPVHLFGQAAPMEDLMALAEKHDFRVIEDNAQAIGCKYRFRDGSTAMAGTIGHIGTTSFYPTKNLGGYGDGGAIFTNDDSLAAAIRTITNHGSDRKYYYDSIGVNSRLDSFQAAVLVAKLAKLDQYNAARKQAADYYDQQLTGIHQVTVPARTSHSDHVFHQYTIRVTDGRRDALQQYLGEQGIPSMIYYPVPLHLSEAYKSFGYNAGDFPVSEQLSSEVLSLPMHTELTAEQLDHIIFHIRNFFA